MAALMLGIALVFFLGFLGQVFGGGNPPAGHPYTPKLRPEQRAQRERMERERHQKA
jgi:hypothetical protein